MTVVLKAGFPRRLPLVEVSGDCRLSLIGTPASTKGNNRTTAGEILGCGEVFSVGVGRTSITWELPPQCAMMIWSGRVMPGPAERHPWGRLHPPLQTPLQQPCTPGNVTHGRTGLSRRKTRGRRVLTIRMLKSWVCSSRWRKKLKTARRAGGPQPPPDQHRYRRLHRHQHQHPRVRLDGKEGKVVHKRVRPSEMVLSLNLSTQCPGRRQGLNKW